MRTAFLAVVVAACGSSDPSPDAGPPAWDKTLPDASVMGVRRGLTPARGIVHLHSPYSHDACDGMPRGDGGLGAPNEPCLADLRAALCTDRIDFAALTDHDDTMADEDFTALFNMRGDDVAIKNSAGEQIGSRMTCADGHTVTFSVGGENDLMPVMLDRHVPGTVAERHATYNGTDAAALAAFRTAGGLVWIAHTEQHPIEQLRALRPDGIELYNLHANIDPDIRADYLGLDASGAITAVLPFADTQPGHAEPDLAILSFLTPNAPAIARWNEVLADGRRMPATAGSDAHQNALPTLLADGERGDAYRRVLRWFGNIVLVADPHDPAQIEGALARGRLFAAFEVLGTPDGFDVHATVAGQTYELGDEIAGTGADAVITVHVPAILGLDPSLPAPEIRARILYIGGGTAPVEVAAGSGPELSAPMTGPGAYRVEVTMVPHHLKPYLGDLRTQIDTTEVPWIYASPIYKRPVAD